VGILIRRYGLAVLCSAVSTLVAVVFYPVVEPIQFVPFFPAVTISALFGGYGPGLLATILTALAGWYLFLPPTHSLEIHDPITAVRVAGYVVVALLSSLLGAALQEARSRAEIARQAAERASEQANAEQARLQQVLAVLPEGVVVVDATGQVLMRNDFATEILGMPGQGARIPTGGGVSRRTRRLDGTPYSLDDLPIARSLRRGEVVRGEQLLVENAATGQLIPLLVSSAPVYDTAGARAGAVSVFSDITAIRDLEASRDSFLAGVSHDLKNPLTTIHGVAQLLEREAEREGMLPAERVAPRVGAIVDATHRMTRLLDELMDVARIRMGSLLELQPTSTDLVALLRRAVAEQQATTERHQLHLETAEPELVGSCDGRRLGRVLVNLLGNAFKYSPDGGAITVSLARESGACPRAVIAIRDPGLGIPPEDLPQIFERFHRGRNVAAAIPGTGLGLTGARQIVEQHGGSIAVESQEGRGTTVTIVLPLGPTQRHRHPEEDDPPSSPAPKPGAT
jgi:signal transduction histidine kinase